MANYVYLEDNIIKEYYDFLPQSWRNISGFNLIKDEDYLKSLGWRKVIKSKEDYDASHQVITGYNYNLEDDNVYEIPVIEDFDPNNQPIQVPNQISATQLRLWLVRNNISLSSIEDAINSLEDEMIRKELFVKWEYAPYFERNNPFINQIGSILGLGSEQIDQAFIEAFKYD